MNIHEKGHAPYELCKIPESKKERGSTGTSSCFSQDTTSSVFPCFFHVDFPFSFHPFFHLGMAWHGSTMSFCMWALLAEKMHMASRGTAPWFFLRCIEKANRDEVKITDKKDKNEHKKKLKSHFGLEIPLLILLMSTAADSGHIFSITMPTTLSFSIRGNCGEDMQLCRSLLPHIPDLLLLPPIACQ